MSQVVDTCWCIRLGEKECRYKTCSNCGSDNIVFRKHHHCCKNCNRLQDVVLLSPTIKCKCGNEFPREEEECPECIRRFWS